MWWILHFHEVPIWGCHSPPTVHHPLWVGHLVRTAPHTPRHWCLWPPDHRGIFWLSLLNGRRGDTQNFTISEWKLLDCSPNLIVYLFCPALHIQIKLLKFSFLSTTKQLPTTYLYYSSSILMQSIPIFRCKFLGTSIFPALQSI